MNKEEFLGQLKSALKSLPTRELDEITADYQEHFDESAAHGRTGEETATALGNPRRLAREHLSDTFYYHWQYQSHPISFVKWLLVSAGLSFLLPATGILILCVAIGGIGLLLALVGTLIGNNPLFPMLATGILAAALVALSAAILTRFILLRHDPMSSSGQYDAHDPEETIEKELNWTPGKHMTITLPAEVHWKPTETTRAVIRGAPWLIEHVQLKNEQLGGRFAWRFFKNNHIHLELEGPSIEQWKVIGSGELHLHEVSQPELHLEIAGSGDIRATGTVENVHVVITGSGDVDIGSLIQQKTWVDLTSRGDATIAPSEEAILTITGSGDIKLLSEPPHIKTQKTGNGDIRLADGSRI